MRHSTAREVLDGLMLGGGGLGDSVSPSYLDMVKFRGDQ